MRTLVTRPSRAPQLLTLQALPIIGRPAVSAHAIAGGRLRTASRQADQSVGGWNEMLVSPGQDLVFL